MSTFRDRLAAHLTETPPWGRGVGGPISADSITDIDVRWDGGSTHENEDWGESIRPASLEVEVTLRDGRRVGADPAWCIKQLLRIAAGLDTDR